MEDDKQRPKWSAPELVVLYRSTDEENVLLGCKQRSDEGKGPDHTVACITFSTPCNAPATS